MPRILRCCCITLLAFFCASAASAQQSPDTARFYDLLRLGDSVYSGKGGYGSFLGSLKYYDSAEAIAGRSGDTLLLADAVFARARVYDAWNKEPHKTIELFTEATRLLKAGGADPRRTFYAEHLVAHAYDKIGDSSGATGVLRRMMAELAAMDTAHRRPITIISEMALIATEVHAYALADSILHSLARRGWIANNPDTYNYLDHYYLTQSRLDMYWRKKTNTPYLDSLSAAYRAVHTLYDSLYYAQNLADLYAATGAYSDAYQYRTVQQRLQSALNTDKDFEKMQRALVTSETAAGQRKLAYETAMSRARIYALWGLSGLLAVITVLSIYLHRRNKKYLAQSQHLQHANTALDAQISKVEVLNKEIQHRIKNNLYTIYSLLHMQQESTDNEEVIAHLEAARLRVESVASLHDHLLAGGEAVDFGAYIKVLVNKVVACFAERRKVITHISTGPVSLPVNTSFALSLILNEWITNSIKYAHCEGEVLHMEVSIAARDGEVFIDYADDGVAAEGNPAKEGLGTEIIRLLTAQVKGKIKNTDGHPYHFNLCIPNGRK